MDRFLKKKYKTTSNIASKWNEGFKNSGINLVKNSGFENNSKDNWTEEIHKNVNAKFFIDETEKAEGKHSICEEINSNQNSYEIQLKQLGIKLEKGKNYTLKFKTKAQTPGELGVSFGMEKSPWTNYGYGLTISHSLNLGLTGF